jgi:hypothetical protein
MPVQYNLPVTTNQWTQQEVDRYNKLPFYLALQQSKLFPEWTRWNKLIGTTPWQPNMGNTMKGVIVEPSPIARTFFTPNPITQQAKKDIISQYERTNEALLYRHKFESPQFNFLPSFTDFRKKQINTAVKDIAHQITAADDIFARTYVFDLSPYVFISGKAKDANGYEMISAPSSLGNADRDAGGKTTNFLQYAVSLIGNNKGNLSLKVIKKVLDVMREDMQVPAYEGMVNTPKDNESIKGKYVLLGSNEAFSALTFDEHVLQYKPLGMNLLNDEFAGELFGRVTYMLERFPIRIAADGTCPAPQRYEASADAFNQYETVPNPDYVNAPFEVAFFMGAGAYDKISVGPPPSEFAGGKISETKFNKLFWNGEVRITDNILVNYGSVETPELDTNKYGEALQLISSVAFGILPVNKRHVLPIVYRRWRVETN